MLKLKIEHCWRLTPVEAIALQHELCGRVERNDRLSEICRVAGVDVGFEQDGRLCWTAGRLSARCCAPAVA